MLLWCRSSQGKVTGSGILRAFVLVLAVRSLVLQKVLGPSQELACFLVILYLLLSQAQQCIPSYLYAPGSLLVATWPLVHGSQSPSRKAQHHLLFHLVIHSTTMCEGTAFIPISGSFPPTFPSPVRT